MELVILESNPQGPEALALLHEAALEAQKLYPELHNPAAPRATNLPTPPRGAYFVAFSAMLPVGMGAHRPLDQDTTEVRRIFVAKDARHQGIARAILRTIEAHAQAQGFRRLLLETGNRQLAAVRLYESCGFTRIPPFGTYASDPTSVCFSKELQPATPSEA